DAVADLDTFLGTYLGIDFPFTASQSKLACPPLSPANSAELVERLGRVIDAVAGRHEVHAVPYGTDASTLSLPSIPPVGFGPGHIGQAHTMDEWIDLAQLEPAAEILYRFACGAG